MAIDPSKYQIYAEKDLNRAQIDWGTVAGTLAAGLDSIRTEREARRQKIQDDTVDAMNKLNEVPDVNNQSLSQMIINASNDQKDLLQTRLDLVKRGISNPKDYKLLMNNMQNGYKSLSTIVQNYDKYYTSKMEAIESGTQSELDAFVAETVEQFGNLEGKKLWTNPVNGQLQLVTMIPDPENPGQYIMPDPNKNPEKFQNPNNVNTIMRFNEKKKVLQDEAKKVTDTIGAYITSFVSDEYGNVVTVEDFSKRKIGGKPFEEWMKNQIGFLTATDNDVAQILTNSGEYTFTSSKADKGPNKIFVNNSSGKPVLELPPGAKERAEQLAKEAIDSQIDKKITQTQPPSNAQQRRDDDIDDAGYIKELNTIMTGNKTDALAALKRRIDTKNASVKFEDDKIVSFQITDDQIILKRKKGDPFIIDRKQATGLEDDPETKDIDESVNVLTTLDDIVSINDVLAPTPLSKGKIQDLIKRENITLGKRREEGIDTRTPKPEIEVFTPKSLAPDGTSLSSYLIDKLGRKLGATTGNKKIKAEIQKAIQTYMPLELSKDLNANPDLYGPTTVTQVGNENKFIITIGKEKVEVTTDTGTPGADIVDKVAEAINKAREKVNKNRTNPNLSGSNFPLYRDWKKDNPPPATYKQYLEEKKAAEKN